MVQRVVDFVTRLSKACHTEVSFRGLTEVVSDALVALFPEASVVIFERDAHVDTVRAVAGARIPSAWEMRAVHLAEVPLIAEAFAYPDRVLRGGALRRLRLL